MHKAFLDTNLYIDWLNNAENDELLQDRSQTRYLSSVVLMELRAGAKTARAQRTLSKLVKPYEAAKRIVPPSRGVYEQAGALLQALRSAGRETRRAALLADVLIALSARSIGAVLYTQDRIDFPVIESLLDFRIAYV